MYGKRLRPHTLHLPASLQAFMADERLQSMQTLTAHAIYIQKTLCPQLSEHTDKRVATGAANYGFRAVQKPPIGLNLTKIMYKKNSQRCKNYCKRSRSRTLHLLDLLEGFYGPQI